MPKLELAAIAVIGLSIGAIVDAYGASYQPASYVYADSVESACNSASRGDTHIRVEIGTYTYKALSPTDISDICQ